MPLLVQGAFFLSQKRKKSSPAFGDRVIISLGEHFSSLAEVEMFQDLTKDITVTSLFGKVITGRIFRERLSYLFLDYITA